MSESTLQSKIMAFCKTMDVLCYKFASPSKRGVPDLLVVSNGRCLFLEVKNPNGRGRVSALQQREIDRLNRNDTPAFVVDDLDTAKDIVTTWLNSN